MELLVREKLVMLVPGRYRIPSCIDSVPLRTKAKGGQVYFYVKIELMLRKNSAISQKTRSSFYPYAFVRSGYVNNGVQRAGDYGHYWTITARASSQATAYDLGFTLRQTVHLADVSGRESGCSEG